MTFIRVSRPLKIATIGPVGQRYVMYFRLVYQ